MKTLAEMGQKQLFVLKGCSEHEAQFVGGSKVFNYVLLCAGVVSWLFAAYVFKAEGLGLLFALVAFFGLVFLTSFFHSRRKRYGLEFDFDDRRVKLTKHLNGHAEMVEASDFSCFDALRIESNIATPNFSVTKTVLVSLVRDGKPICFLAKNLFGFPSVEDATAFANDIGMKTGWPVSG